MRDDARGLVRRSLPPDVIPRLARIDPLRSALSLLDTFGLVALLFAVALTWRSAWVGAAVFLLMPVAHHRIAVLAHETAHYRLFETRWLNDLVGWLASASIGVSTFSYRIVHRIHHNHLYEAIDPDMPLQGGYPRGRAYLLGKLAKDALGFTFWKNYAYFFGAPGMNRDTGGKGGATGDPLADTSAALRMRALRDRWLIVAFQVVLMGALALAGHLGDYLLFWVLPMLTLYQAVLRLRAVLEHGAIADRTSPLTAARTNIEIPWIARLYLFPLHVNYHIEHHLFPAVPHYHLPALHAALEAQGLLARAESRPFADTVRLVFGPRALPAAA